jgi:hypothetical protein
VSEVRICHYCKWFVLKEFSHFQFVSVMLLIICYFSGIRYKDEISSWSTNQQNWERELWYFFFGQHSFCFW